MSWIAVAVAGATVVTGAYSANQQKKAGERAARSQGQAAEAGIEEQQRQFDAVKELLSPYVQAGNKSLSAQGDLVGINGVDAQASAIKALEASPQFAALTQQGESAILQNASATGGLRGGNTQAALMQFRPQMLAQTINDQYARLGGLTSIGQNAAAGTGNAGMQTGNNIAQLLQMQGAAQAGGALAVGKAHAGYANAIQQGLGMYFGMGGKF